MIASCLNRRVLVAFCLAVFTAASMGAQAPARRTVCSAGWPGGQRRRLGADAPELVEAMLNLAKVTPQDFVMDLGSGDGRNVIAAAKRGARAVGVEFNPKMVELSKSATAAGVGDKATFVEGDMYQADISKASVMALFLLPSNMLQLRQNFSTCDRAAGSCRTRSGSKGGIRMRPSPSRTAAARGAPRSCGSCPAKVGGKWRLGDGISFSIRVSGREGYSQRNADFGRQAPRGSDPLHGRNRRIHREGHRQSHGRQRAWCRVRDDVDSHQDQLN